MNFSIKVLLKLLNRTQTKSSTVSEAKGDKGLSVVPVGSLRLRDLSGATGGGMFTGSHSEN